MEYPGSLLKKPLRRAIMIAFIAAFFIITPIIVMYTAGYRYDWSSGLIRETGSLSIDVLPENAKVTLDGLLLDATIPVRLKNIAPKKYNILITAPGYYAWEKEVEVRRKQTTYIKDIQLLKQSKPIQIVSGTIHNLVITPGARSLVFTRGTSPELMLYDLRSHHETLLATFSKPQNINYFWSNRHNYAAITVGSKPYTSVLVIDLNNPKDIINISTLQKETISRVQWKESAEPVLYFGTTSTINSYYPKLRENRRVTTNNYADWSLNGSDLWTMDRTTSSLIITKDRLGFNEVFTVVSSTSYEAFNPADFMIEAIYNNHIVLNHSSGKLMLLVRGHKQFVIPASHAIVSPYNNWLIMWNESELWTYAEGEEPFLLHRTGNKLTGVTPIDSYNTLALQFDHTTKVLYPYEYIEQELLTEVVLNLVADTDNRQIYFTTTQGIYSLAY